MYLLFFFKWAYAFWIQICQNVWWWAINTLLSFFADHHPSPNQHHNLSLMYLQLYFNELVSINHLIKIDDLCLAYLYINNAIDTNHQRTPASQLYKTYVSHLHCQHVLDDLLTVGEWEIPLQCIWFYVESTENRSNQCHVEADLIGWICWDAFFWKKCEGKPVRVRKTMNKFLKGGNRGWVFECGSDQNKWEHWLVQMYHDVPDTRRKPFISNL